MIICYCKLECIVSTLDDNEVFKNTIYHIYFTIIKIVFENFNILQEVFKPVFFGKHALFFFFFLQGQNFLSEHNKCLQS